MSTNDRRAPIGTLEATLALSIQARRAVLRRAGQHLLPSAPLLGRPTRRLSRMTGNPAALAALRWRLQHVFGETRSSPASRAPESSGQHPATRLKEAAAPASSASRGTPASRNEKEERPAEVDRAAAADRALPVPQTPSPTSVARDDARFHAAAPTLAWFARRQHGQIAAAPIVSARNAAAHQSPALPLARARHATIAASRVVAGPLAHAASASPRAAHATPHADSSLPSAVARVMPAPGLGAGQWMLQTAIRRPASPWMTSAPRGSAAQPAGSFLTPRESGGETRAIGAAPLPVRSGPADGVASVPVLIGAANPVAAAAAYAVETVSRVLRERVAAEVEESVARVARRTAQAPASRPPDAAPPVPVRIDDRTVLALIGRMRSIEREEQFRHGYLR